MKINLKLREKILMISILPIIAVGLIIYFVVSSKVTSAMLNEVKQNLISACVSVAKSYDVCIDGEYRVDLDGVVWKGENFNISTETQIIDEIKKRVDLEVTMFYGDTRIVTTILDERGNRVVGTKASDEVINHVLQKGQNYYTENVEINGKRYVGYYEPLYQSGGDEVIGMFFAGRQYSVVSEEVKSITDVILKVVLVILVICILIVIIFINGFVKILHGGFDMIKQVADGNLSFRVDRKLIERSDEIGKMSREVRNLRESLTNMIKGLTENASHLALASTNLKGIAGNTADNVEQVETAIDDIAKGAASQSEETQHSSENVIKIGNMIGQTREEVEKLYKNSNEMKERGEEAAEVLKELEIINNKVKDYIDVVYEQINTTNESAVKIREATSLITSIAEETNLLSLNASIEAARAGEQGKGFAVVATNIQKLAEQSNESAKIIDKIINVLILDSGKSVEIINEVRDTMIKQLEKISKTSESFSKVKDGINESILSVNNISTKTNDMDIAKDAVIDGVQNLTAIAEENAAASEQTAASIAEVTSAMAEVAKSAESLQQISKELEESIKIFKLRQDV